MRLFLAVNLPPELRAEIHRSTESWRNVAPGVSWTRPELLHFTVSFLCEVGDELVVRIREGVSAAIAGHAAFQIQLAGAGAFPNFAAPRVLWIGVKDQQSLSALAGEVERACTSLGFARDARGFHAHVTLGRVPRPMSRADAEALERVARGAHNEFTTDVTSVDLMRSALSGRGPRYTLLAVLPLRVA